MKVNCAAFTHQGLKRSNNEDSILCDGWVRNKPMSAPFLVLDDCVLTNVCVFAVADGLGGHSSGEIASQFVVSRISNLIGNQVNEESLSKELQSIHRELFDISSSVLDYRGMGSTVAGLVASPLDKTFLFHVGDSRIYRREDRFLQLMTKDDRVEPQGYGETDISLPTSSLLLQCLGGVIEFSQISPHIITLEASEKTEVFLICSDGLSDMLSQDEIEESMSENLEQWILNLFEKVCNAGALDNISILIVEVKPESSPPDLTDSPQSDTSLETLG